MSETMPTGRQAETALERARRLWAEKTAVRSHRWGAVIASILAHLEAQASAATPPPATESSTKDSPSDAALSPAEKLWQERHPAASVQQQYKAGYWLREQELIAQPTPPYSQSAPQGTESGLVGQGSECVHKWESWATKKPYMPVSWCSQCGVLAYNGRIHAPRVQETTLTSVKPESQPSAEESATTSQDSPWYMTGEGLTRGGLVWGICPVHKRAETADHSPVLVIEAGPVTESKDSGLQPWLNKDGSIKDHWTDWEIKSHSGF